MRHVQRSTPIVSRKNEFLIPVTSLRHYLWIRTSFGELVSQKPPEQCTACCWRVCSTSCRSVNVKENRGKQICEWCMFLFLLTRNDRPCFPPLICSRPCLRYNLIHWRAPLLDCMFPMRDWRVIGNASFKGRRYDWLVLLLIVKRKRNVCRYDMKHVHRVYRVILRTGAGWNGSSFNEVVVFFCVILFL